MTHSVPASAIGKAREQLLRDGLYLKVHLCEKCLPATATKNPMRRGLFGDHETKTHGSS